MFGLSFSFVASTVLLVVVRPEVAIKPSGFDGTAELRLRVPAEATVNVWQAANCDLPIVERLLTFTRSGTYLLALDSPQGQPFEVCVLSSDGKLKASFAWPGPSKGRTADTP